MNKSTLSLEENNEQNKRTWHLVVTMMKERMNKMKESYMVLTKQSNRSKNNSMTMSQTNLFSHVQKPSNWLTKI